MATFCQKRSARVRLGQRLARNSFLTSEALLIAGGRGLGFDLRGFCLWSDPWRAIPITGLRSPFLSHCVGSGVEIGPEGRIPAKVVTASGLKFLGWFRGFDLRVFIREPIEINLFIEVKNFFQFLFDRVTVVHGTAQAQNKIAVLQNGT